MGVNIWVTNKTTGEKGPVCWGETMAIGTVNGELAITTVDGLKGFSGFRETPAEIMALVAAEERKQARERIAAQILASTVAADDERNYAVGDVVPDYLGNAIKWADALLDALEHRA